jgi:hypothetical protein
MPLESRQAEPRNIEALRDIYRQEMSCQIIHDSIHSRPGWTQEYLLIEDGVKVGYGSVAVGGPWLEKPGRGHWGHCELRRKLTMSRMALPEDLT